MNEVPDVRALRPFLVVNPNSAGGSTGRRWARLAAQARAAFGKIEVGVTTSPLDALALTRQAIEAGHRLVCAVGGDGTINEVVNGFFRDDGTLFAEDAVFAVLPRGTGSDFRRTAGVPTDWESACRRVADAPVRRIDLGHVTFRAHDGGQGRRWFVNIASCGASGEVVKAVNESGKRLGALSFKLATAAALRRYRDRTIDLTIDGGPPERVPVTVLAVANGQYFGGGMMVAPGARFDDGEFACTLWSNYRLSDFVFRQKGIHDGSHVTWSRTRTFVARTVRADSDETVLLDVDGEQPGTLPATFEVHPAALAFKA